METLGTGTGNKSVSGDEDVEGSHGVVEICTRALKENLFEGIALAPDGTPETDQPIRNELHYEASLAVSRS